MTEPIPASESDPAKSPAATARQDPEAELAIALAELAGARTELEAARKEASEATLRAQAELQNVRKRLERDAENTRKFLLEKFVGELLAVVDSLDRGLAALPADQEALRAAREGTGLTLKLFKDTLRRHGVEEIDPRGETFNPQFHEAVAHLPDGGVAANTVVDVLQKGFTLSGRLLRPAMVAVSRAP